ncbi:hypothetical protein K504DRAFT_457896 [Pleomassaria siparia CBS 279.74]|uniref:Uncharacterized protein n=1 Tax=Pleomassaria siparia CBS 279.74 TaxID=1314801 RepID=A0A6G1KSH3_9PLEO|nr:hypothetical protein K504DRAFT_457896 [Pleomassaria siparia CBS 279.74]
MGALLSIFNRLLPFTSPTTPVYQDLIHTAILFLTLYYGPQLVEVYNTHVQPPQPHPDPGPDPNDPLDATQDDNLPIDENLILIDSDEELDPPPLAPTPPLGFAGLAQPPLPRDDWGAQNGFDAGPANANGHGHGHGHGHMGAAGMDPDRPRPTPQNRTVGAKKAKSLARKDQRRAYHEFHRQEAEIRRLREAEGKDEREALLAAEKARRAEVEREIQDRERLERERKKEEERKEAEEERLRRERVVDRVRRELKRVGAVDLVGVAWEEGKDRLWMERLVRASGILSQTSKTPKPDSHTMITGQGWLVRVDRRLMADAYAEAVAYGDSKDGNLSFADLGTILERAVRARMEV